MVRKEVRLVSGKSWMMGVSCDFNGIIKLVQALELNGIGMMGGLKGMIS